MNRRKIATILVVVALISAIVLATYFYLAMVHERKGILNRIDSAATSYLLRIRGDVDILLYLLENSNATDTIKYETMALGYTADTLSFLTNALYDYTSDPKCYNMHDAFDKLSGFIFDVLNDEPSKIVPEFMKNKEIFEGISDILNEMTAYGSVMEIPDTLIGELQITVNGLSK